jgi:hypothetical protein
VASGNGPVPKEGNRRARKDHSNHRASTVDGNQNQQAPTRASHGLINEETLELAKNGAFDGGQAEIVNENTSQEWLFKVSAGAPTRRSVRNEENADLHHVDLLSRAQCVEVSPQAMLIF